MTGIKRYLRKLRDVLKIGFFLILLALPIVLWQVCFDNKDMVLQKIPGLYEQPLRVLLVTTEPPGRDEARGRYVYKMSSKDRTFDTLYVSVNRKPESGAEIERLKEKIRKIFSVSQEGMRTRAEKTEDGAYSWETPVWKDVVIYGAYTKAGDVVSAVSILLLTIFCLLLYLPIRTIIIRYGR